MSLGEICLGWLRYCGKISVKLIVMIVFVVIVSFRCMLCDVGLKWVSRNSSSLVMIIMLSYIGVSVL